MVVEFIQGVNFPREEAILLPDGRTSGALDGECLSQLPWQPSSWGAAGWCVLQP